jgi:hypothetical protein
MPVYLPRSDPKLASVAVSGGMIVLCSLTDDKLQQGNLL